MQGRELIMDLTNEQGGDRRTQVQPPIPAWEQFFGVRLMGPKPTYRLQNRGTNEPPAQCKVSRHKHVMTIEISGSDVIRPAILRLRWTGVSAFDYWIYTRRQREWAHCNWLLSNMAVAMPGRRTRRWIVVR